MMTNIEFFIATGFAIFLVGCFGAIINKGNLIKFIVSIETIILAAMYMFALLSYITEKHSGVVLAILLIPVAATELAICLFVMNKRKEK